MSVVKIEAASGSTVRVETPLGAVEGLDQGDLHVFRGIRYAQSPTGDRRFRAPVPVEPWSGTLDATRFGPIPPQTASRLNLAMGEFEAEQDEDCLSLNIWRPARAQISGPEGPLPVLVWIHGGGFSSGAGSLDWYSGAELARRHDMVVVSVNYRLGALGWLRIPGVSTGNMGLFDQATALHWVQDNIAAFGGDPGAVTVAGQSAGGWSISLMLASEACRGLFARAIVQSAPLGVTPAPPERAEAIAAEFMALLELDPNQTDALVEMPADKLLAAARTLGLSKKRFGRVVTPIGPCQDGELVTRPPLEVARGGGLAAVDLMIGTTREEVMAFLRFDPDFETATDEQVADFYARCFGAEGEAILADMRRRRPGGSRAEIVAEAESALKFVQPSLAFAEAAVRQGLPTYVFQFDWQSPMPQLDACHCLELPFVFGNPEAWTDSPMLAGSDPDAVAGLSDAMQAGLAAFAKTGRPETPLLPDWPAYEAAERLTMCFDDIVTVQSDPGGMARPLPGSADADAEYVTGSQAA